MATRNGGKPPSSNFAFPYDLCSHASRISELMPRLSLLLLSVALLAIALGLLYSLKLDPEISYWGAATERKLDWVEEMRRKHGYVIGIVGGSTTTFGIDAEHIHGEYNLPVANLGLHAGMGPDACVGLGFIALKRGDTLILSLEPSMLTTDDGVAGTRLGSKLALRLQKPELINWRKPPPYSALSTPSQLQPGGYHFMTMLGKLALSKPLYRYRVEEMRPGGLQTTTERRPLATSNNFETAESSYLLSPAGSSFLQAVKEEADRRGIKVVYLLPWSYRPQEMTEQSRKANKILLTDISERIPVLPEPSSGVHDRIEDFSDSVQHLTAEAARWRSSCLSKAIVGSKELGDEPQP